MTLDEGVELRYALSHPVRLVARRSLENGDDVERVHRAAADYLLRRVAQWRDELDTAAGPDVLAAFSAAAPDVEAAVDAAVIAGRTDTALDLVLAAEQLWIAAGRVAQARILCARLLARASGRRTASGAAARRPWPSRLPPLRLAARRDRAAHRTPAR